MRGEAIRSWRGLLAAEARAFVTPGGRMVDEIECVLSVLLAIVLAHLIGARNVSWAAFSGFMVMRGHVSETLRRGILRIAGTVTGAAITLMLWPVIAGNPFASSAALALIGGCSLYAALTHRYAYAFLFVGLTFAMILLDRPRSASELQAFALTRMLEVFSGTAACVLVSMLSTLTLRRRWPGARRPTAFVSGWHPEVARHAAQAAVALALLPLVHEVWQLPDLSQAAVAIMAVMMVPLSNLGNSGYLPVGRRMVLRVLGCACGAALAAITLLIAQGSATILLAGSLLGVMLGRHIENGASSIAYSGTQFTLAMLVALVPDNYAAPDPHAGLARLIGTVVGIALLEPVLAAFYIFTSRSPVDAKGRGADQQT